jgi:hypothetical protein
LVLVFLQKLSADVYQRTPLAVVVEGSVTEVTSMHVEITADVVTPTDEMTSMSVQTSDATTSLADVAVSTTTVPRSSASKTIVPSMIHATSRPDLNKELLSHPRFLASASSSQDFHDSHRVDSLLTQ